MSYSHRIFIYGPIGLLLLVVAGYALYWQMAANALAARLDAANGREVMPGIVFAFAQKEIGGFPFRLDAVLNGVTFSHREPAGETAWRSEKLALHMLSYGPEHFIFEAAGLQSFARPGAAGGSPQVLYLTPGTARASAILRHGRLMRFDLDLVQAEAKDAAAGDQAHTITAARAQLHLRDDGGGGIDVVAQLDSLHVGENYQFAPAPDLPLVQLQGKIAEAQIFDALREGRENPSAVLALWRQRSGTLAVGDLVLDWGTAQARVVGNLALDENDLLTGTLHGGGTERAGKIPLDVDFTFRGGAMQLSARPQPASPSH